MNAKIYYFGVLASIAFGYPNTLVSGQSPLKPPKDERKNAYMHIQIQVNGKHDLSKNLFIEVYEDGIDITGSETDSLIHRNPSILSDFSIDRLMDAMEASDLDVTAIAYRAAETFDDYEQE